VNDSMSYLVGQILWATAFQASAIFLLSALAVIVTIKALHSKRFNLIALIVNAFPAATFILFVWAKIYDAVNGNWGFFSWYNVGYLCIAWINFLAAGFFFWAITFRSNLPTSEFARTIGVISAISGPAAFVFDFLWEAH
jgi:hypothetical protein